MAKKQRIEDVVDDLMLQLREAKARIQELKDINASNQQESEKQAAMIQAYRSLGLAWERFGKARGLWLCRKCGAVKPIETAVPQGPGKPPVCRDCSGQQLVIAHSIPKGVL